MNPKLKRGITLILTIAVVYLGIDIAKKLYYKSQGTALIEQMPDLELKTLDGNAFNLQEIPETKETLLIYYSTECSHCIDEVKELRDHSRILDPYNVYLISIEDAKQIVRFKDALKIGVQHQLNFLVDPKWEFPQLYNIEATPSLFFYDKNGKLTSKHVGALPTKTIVARLKS